MKYRGLVVLAVATLLAAGCASGDNDKPDANRPATEVADSSGAPGQGAKLPDASSFEEIAALLKPTLGPCQRMVKTGHPAVELNRADRARGGTKKAVCWYQEQQFTIEFLLIDSDNSTIEKFLKDNDMYSSEQVGMGFTVRLVASSNDEMEATVQQKLKESGLPFLNCEHDFTPDEGVDVIEAKTKGCRYTPTPRI